MTMNASPNIFLVEDNDDDAFLTMRALEAAGITHPVRHFRDGQDLVDYLGDMLPLDNPKVKDRPPELILLDLKMPRLGGLETLRWIRQHDFFYPLTVLVFTSSNEPKDVEEAYRLAVNAYLVKPSSLSELIEMAESIRHFWLEQSHLIKPLLSLTPRKD